MLMKRCNVCRRKTGIEKRVNCEGILFCSDDCYEEYDGSPNDNAHPYIDDYDAIRFEYVEWMKSYEDDLYKYWSNREPQKEEMVENINELIDEFYDYYRLEGTDGVFSEEIYNYLLAFEELKKAIINWEANERALKRLRRTRSVAK